MPFLGILFYYFFAALLVGALFTVLYEQLNAFLLRRRIRAHTVAPQRVAELEDERARVIGERQQELLRDAEVARVEKERKKAEAFEQHQQQLERQRRERLEREALQQVRKRGHKHGKEMLREVDSLAPALALARDRVRANGCGASARDKEWGRRERCKNELEKFKINVKEAGDAADMSKAERERDQAERKAARASQLAEVETYFEEMGEPDADGGDVVTVRLRFPDGSNAARRFLASTSLRDPYPPIPLQTNAQCQLYAFADLQRPMIRRFTLELNYPHRVLANDEAVTLAAAGLAERASVLVIPT